MIIYIPVPAHPGCPGQNPESRKMVVFLCGGTLNVNSDNQPVMLL